uniref:Uncharacterized protein n=1 Tax=Arundo donax TaxID=35708 RepID=A0A0A9F559_ARUDO
MRTKLWWLSVRRAQGKQPRLLSTLLRQVILQRGKLRVHSLGGLLQNQLQSV